MIDELEPQKTEPIKEENTASEPVEQLQNEPPHEVVQVADDNWVKKRMTVSLNSTTLKEVDVFVNKYISPTHPDVNNITKLLYHLIEQHKHLFEKLDAVNSQSDETNDLNNTIEQLRADLEDKSSKLERAIMIIQELRSGKEYKPKEQPQTENSHFTDLLYGE